MRACAGARGARVGLASPFCKKLDDLGVDLPIRVRLQVAVPISGEGGRLGSDVWAVTQSISLTRLPTDMPSAMSNRQRGLGARGEHRDD